MFCVHRLDQRRLRWLKRYSPGVARQISQNADKVSVRRRLRIREDFYRVGVGQPRQAREQADARAPGRLQLR